MKGVGDSTDGRRVDEDTVVTLAHAFDHREELGVIDDLGWILAA